MYLKRVDMENFKSFGGKVSIPLMEGYMAITGPNGSGKSNITDAILFVLGPKSSKAMRAGKLTDLIYNGNKEKKADYTKVTLYFENSDRALPWDADEVRFTRIVKMSAGGENYSSNFFINDQKSSMSEFDSLLTRARISADGYNMVQQGDVTDIIKMGNVERRRIIDSISGISSYDSDIAKADAEKAEAEQNMTLTNVVIEELESQIDKLSKETEAAKKYMAAKADLDLANAQLVHRHLFNEEENYKYTSENVAKTQKEIDELTASRDSYNTKIKEIEASIKDVEAKIAEKIGPEYGQLKSDIEKVKIDKALSDDIISREQDQKASSEESLAEYLGAVRDIEKDLRECIKTVDSTKIEIDAKTEELEAAKQENDRVSAEMKNIGGESKALEERLSVLETEIDSKGNQEHELTNKVSTAELQEEEASRAVAALEQDIASADFEIKDAEWNIGKIKQEAGPISNIDQITNSIYAMKKEESELEKQEQDINSAIRRLNEEYSGLAAEKKLADKMSRGSDAVVAVLEMRDKGTLRGIHGTIAELATVAPEYETALSVAAGGKMQAIIVDDDEVAAKAIAELKRTGHGRATFLPLNKMLEGKPRARAIMVVKQSLGYAIDLIDFRPEYRAAFWYVFADTIVVDNLDNARRLMGGVRIVTKTGELMEASGAMTGGTLKTQTLKFGAASQSKLDEVSMKLRAANSSIDTIKAKLAELRTKIHEADDQMRNVGKGNIELQTKLGKFEAKLGELKDKRKRAVNDLESKKTVYLKSKEDRTSSVSELAAVTKELNDLKDERTKIRARITEIAPAELQQRIQDARDAVYRITEEKNALMESLAALNAEKSEYENNKRYTDKNIAETRYSIEQNVKKIVDASARSTELKIKYDALKSIEKEMEAGIQGLTDDKEALTKSKYENEKDRDITVSNIETKEGIRSSMQASLNIILAKLEDLRTQAANTVLNSDAPLPSEETIKRTIRSCESTINSLGNVNLRAIDDYEEKKSRYDSLKSDIARLTAQIDDLNELTENLNTKKKGLFMDVYNGVNTNFKSIFAELSGGGEAFMALDNEDDPFSGGLMINAKPKNGKMLRLELLSGGEKSLTALSFIFAIQAYQPSPFYVLDEVDMFLDSVNSEMVAKRIKESSSSTQFIQVSLRKVTLTMADHLIGVTRPPNGISKVIMQPNLAEVSKYEEEAQRRIKEAEEKEAREKEGVQQ